MCVCSLSSWDVCSFCHVYVFGTCAVAEMVVLESQESATQGPEYSVKNHSPRLSCSCSFIELPCAFLLLKY